MYGKSKNRLFKRGQWRSPGTYEYQIMIIR